MLNERTEKVLCSIVKSYIQKPDPVGSGFVSKRFAFNLSSATIRNIMADLEADGFLLQPHTSAGRVPTDKGYRYYVDTLGRQPMSTEAGFAEDLGKRVREVRTDMNNMLREATEVLSDISHYLAFAVPVRPDGSTLNRVQMFRYRGRQIAVMLLTNEGIIKNKIIDSTLDLSQRDLNRISDFINSEFSGQPISEIRAKMMRQLAKESALCDILVTRAAQICRDALVYPESEVILSGMSVLLSLPDFSDRLSEVIRALEDKHSIVRLLEELLSQEGVHVLIGSENPVSNMSHMSIVLAPYMQGGKVLGSVGMIGPTRMDYLRAIPIVEAAARLISNTISE